MGVFYNGSRAKPMDAKMCISFIDGSAMSELRQSTSIARTTKRRSPEGYIVKSVCALFDTVYGGSNGRVCPDGHKV